MSYSQLLQRLLQVNMHKGMKFGLDNTLRLCRAMGNPQRHFASIHIAGTNGKGSVVAKLSAALQCAGYRVGTYTSPHLNSFRERISINTQLISEDSVAALLTALFSAAEKEDIPATFFELTTCLAFKYFAEEKIDIAVLETGLGGRLDATNIVQPLLSIITSISPDHTDILGSTLEKIALEKAGIIKAHTPVVIGPCVPQALIAQIARQHDSPFYSVGGEYLYYDQENSAIAKKALEVLASDLPVPLAIPESAIAKGLEIRPACRMQIFTKDMLPNWIHKAFPAALVMDVAHNPDGLAHLMRALQDKYPGKALRFVCGLSKSKDIKACLEIIQAHAAHIHVVEAQNGRAASAKELCLQLEQLGVSSDKLSCQPDLAKSLLLAIEQSAFSNQILIICGTFFIMQTAYQSLGLDVPSDPVESNEK